MSTPSDSPTVAMTISSAPRALSAVPNAIPSRAASPDSRAPMSEPANFETEAIAMTTTAQNAISGSDSSERSTRRPAVAKKIGATIATVKVSSCSLTSCFA